MSKKNKICEESPSRIKSEFFNKLTAEKQGRIMTALDVLINEGVEQGLERGMNLGKAEIARNLFANGIDIDLIEETTGVNRSELKKLNKPH